MDQEKDQTLAEAAAEAEAPGDTTAAERIKAALARDTLAAESGDDQGGSGGATVPTEPTAVSGGDSEPLPGKESEPDVAAPPPEDWPDCPVCHGEGKVPPQLRHSDTLKTCEGCGGVGQVYTGSLVPEAAIMQCERCQGNGYERTQAPLPPPPPPPPPEQPVTDWQPPPSY